jgi:hypothetical protein
VFSFGFPSHRQAPLTSFAVESEEMPTLAVASYDPETMGKTSVAAKTTLLEFVFDFSLPRGNSPG